MRPHRWIPVLVPIVFVTGCATPAPRPASTSALLRWTADGVLVCAKALDLKVCPGQDMGSPDGPPNLVPPSLQLSSAEDGHGGAIVAWTACLNGDTYVHVQHVDAGAVPRWGSSGVRPCTISWKQGVQGVVADGTGGAIVVWGEQRRFGDLDIYAQHVLGNGRMDPRWPRNGRAVCTAMGTQAGSVVVSDGLGGALVAWEDDRFRRTATAADLGVYAHGAVYAQRLNSSGTPLWAQDGVCVCGPHGIGRIAVLADSAGGALFAWSDLREGLLNSDIYAQRVSARGISEWPRDGVALCKAIQGQDMPCIASDGSGGMMVAWQDYRSWGPRRKGPVLPQVFVQRVSRIGQPMWRRGGIALCEPDRLAGWPSLAPDGSGGAFVLWATGWRWRGRGPGKRLVAQRISPSGAVLWSQAGIVLRSQEGRRIDYIGYLRAVPDGAGGAISSWEERHGTTMRVRAQHVTGAGALPWGSEGVGLWEGPGTQNEPVLCADRAGGAIIVWRDTRRPGFYDVYAQRIGDRHAQGAVAPGRW